MLVLLDYFLPEYGYNESFTHSKEPSSQTDHSATSESLFLRTVRECEFFTEQQPTARVLSILNQIVLTRYEGCRGPLIAVPLVDYPAAVLGTPSSGGNI